MTLHDVFEWLTCCAEAALFIGGLVFALYAALGLVLAASWYARIIYELAWLYWWMARERLLKGRQRA